MYIYINITIERISCWYYWNFTKKANEYKLFSIRTDVQDICLFSLNILFLLFENFMQSTPITLASHFSQIHHPIFTPFIKKEKKICKSNLYCSYTHWGMGKFLVASPWKIIESFSNPARNHQLWIATAQQLSHSY